MPITANDRLIPSDISLQRENIFQNILLYWPNWKPPTKTSITQKSNQLRRLSAFSLAKPAKMFSSNYFPNTKTTVRLRSLKYGVVVSPQQPQKKVGVFGSEHQYYASFGHRSLFSFSPFRFSSNTGPTKLYPWQCRISLRANREKRKRSRSLDLWRLRWKFGSTDECAVKILNWEVVGMADVYPFNNDYGKIGNGSKRSIISLIT